MEAVADGTTKNIKDADLTYRNFGKGKKKSRCLQTGGDEQRKTKKCFMRICRRKINDEGQKEKECNTISNLNNGKKCTISKSNPVPQNSSENISSRFKTSTLSPLSNIPQAKLSEFAPPLQPKSHFIRNNLPMRQLKEEQCQESNVKEIQLRQKRFKCRYVPYLNKKPVNNETIFKNQRFGQDYQNIYNRNIAVIKDVKGDANLSEGDRFYNQIRSFVSRFGALQLSPLIRPVAYIYYRG